MTSRIEKQDKCLVELIVTISPEEFQKALQEAYKHSAKRFTVPGFRKGKAPYALAMRYYGEGVLYDEAIDLALNPAYREALEEHKLEPVARPEMDVLRIGGEEGLEVKLNITVAPEVELGEYKGLEAEKPSAEVSEEEVEAELTRVRERSGRMVPVSGRPAQNGDTAKIDFEGFMDGVAFEGGKAENYDLELGSGSFIPGFEDQIVGHNEGEEFDVNVNFPEQYGAADLAGKPAVFKVKLHSLKFKELPDLDDDFAKDVSEFDTLAEYKDSLRKKLEDAAEQRATHKYEDAVVAAAVENATVELPAVMVDQEVDSQLQRQSQSMSYQGIQLNQYLQYMGKTLEEYKKELRPAAEETVKTALVLEAIAKKEEIGVTEEDRKEEYERLALQFGMPAEEIAKRFAEDSRYIDDRIRGQKTVNWLVEKSKPKKEKKSKKAKKAE